MSSSPKRLGPFPLGMNNRRPDHDMVTEGGRFVRAAVNVDVTQAGYLKRRRGFQKLVEADMHSLWGDGADMYAVDGTTLCRVIRTPSGVTLLPLREGLLPQSRMSYERIGNSVICSDGALLLRLTGSEVSDVSLPVVPSTVTVTGGATGSLAVAKYRVAMVYVTTDGEHSAAPTVYEVSSAGSISITGLPTSFPQGTASIMIFMTAPDESELLRAATLTDPTATFSITTMPTLGQRCMTADLAPMPAGRIVRHYNARVLVADGNALYVSEPYAHGLHNPSKGYFLFGADISVVEPTSNGVYVVSDRSYWMAGDIADAQLNEVLPYGAAAYASGSVPNSNDVWWMSHRGLVVATQDGQASNVQEGQVAVNAARAGAGVVREFDGARHAITSVFREELSSAAARSFMDAEIVRRRGAQ